MKISADTVEEAPTRAVKGIRTGKRIKFEKAITVNCPLPVLYDYWRDFENLPNFISHLTSVTPNDDGTDHWVAETDQGRPIEWDAKVIEDKPDELICWESLPGTEIQNAGCVRFTPAPGGRGTVVRLTWSYTPGAGSFGARIATLLNKIVVSEIAQDLFNFRSLLETGEVPTITGQPQGNRNSKRSKV